MFKEAVPTRNGTGLDYSGIGEDGEKSRTLRDISEGKAENLMVN